MKTRHTGIEILRIALMLGICGIHVASFMGGYYKNVSRILWPCVVGFVFISGYYGVKFSIWKIVRFCTLGMWCAFLAALANSVFYGGDIVERFFEDYKCFWFLHAYIFMMFFAPLINAALTPENALRLGLPILFLVFGWSFAYSFSALRSFVVGLPGFGAQTGLTLVGIYVAARMFHLLECEGRISTFIAICTIVLTAPLTAIRFGTYDSPIALLVAVCLFVLAFRVGIISDRFVHIVLFITPSLFSIYLLQVNGFAWKAFPWGIKRLTDIGVPTYLTFPLLTIGVFLLGLMIDLVRRGILYFIVKKFYFSRYFSL